MKLLVALLLFLVPFAGISSRASALLNVNACSYSYTYYTGHNGGGASCKDAAPGTGGALHDRVMIICRNEIRTTGWIYGPWRYTWSPGSHADCPTISDSLVTVTMQVY